jgi:transcriptional regulator with XRE-family HTH domain
MEGSSDIDIRLARRVRSRREALGLTLDQLAERAGVSRSMISRVERAESSPTAALLGRLAAGLGVTISRLLVELEGRPGALARRPDQPLWRDPETGYLRRALTPPAVGAAVDIVEVTFPPGAAVAYDGAIEPDREQQILLLEGSLAFDHGATAYTLEAGDCLHMRMDRAVRYRNQTDRPCRYLVVVSRLADEGA